MKNRKFVSVIMWTIIAVSFVVTFIAYPHLPDRVPIQFAFDGSVNSYGDKITIFLLPALVLLGYIGIPIFAKIDPKSENYEKFKTTYQFFRCSITVVFAVMHFFILYKIFMPDDTVFDISRSVLFVIGILFIILGNQMPKLKQNYFIGIRTPWTLAHSDVWYKTHRVGGISWTLAGALIIFSQFLPLADITFFIAVITISVLIPVIYSYVSFQKLK